MRRSIAILGATGSIGTQALDIVRRYPERFEAAALVAHTNAEKLFQLVREFRPKVAGLVSKPDALPEDVRFCEWVFGRDAAVLALKAAKPLDALCAIVGIAGLDAVWAALDISERVLLANKEALVTGGALVMEKAAKLGRQVLPVDSEHSAIFQCLQARQDNAIHRLILTCSGGALRSWPKERMYGATVAEVLAHPTWNMGAKITIDSATMMNKGFEVIEARWLFDTPVEKINVVVHPESVIHSMIEFEDGAVIAQMASPDMREPIQFAIGFPERLTLDNKRIDFAELGSLSFHKPDMDKFPALGLAYKAIERGGNIPCALNAANESAVAAYMRDEISFYQISDIAAECMEKIPFIAEPTLEEIFETNSRSRAEADRMIISSLKKY